MQRVYRTARVERTQVVINRSPATFLGAHSWQVISGTTASGGSVQTGIGDPNGIVSVVQGGFYNEFAANGIFVRTWVGSSQGWV